MNMLVDEFADELCASPKNDSLFSDRKSYQVTIRIIEGRELVGSELNPFVTVEMGNQSKKTDAGQHTSSPFFDKNLVFEHSLTPAAFFDQKIKITCSSKKLFQNEIIGIFRLSISTIYEQHNHMYYHKWAVLLDPSDPHSEPRGYLKCNMFVNIVGDVVKIPVTVSDADDDIDENLLLPEGLEDERTAAKYQINIFYCEDLSDLSNTNIKRRILRHGQLLCPYVRVVFAGHVASTPIKRNTCDPIYNSKITIRDWFPSLIRRIKFQVRDSSEKVIATTYLQLDEITDYSNDGFLPVFGPAYINLYGDMLDSTNDSSLLNLGIGEGVAYRGRIFCQISVKKLNSSGHGRVLGIPMENKLMKRSETHVESLRRHLTIFKEQLPDIQSFLLTCVVEEVCMLSTEKFQDTDNFSIELSLGKEGRISKEFPIGYCPKMPEDSDLEKYLSPLSDIPKPRIALDLGEQEKANLVKYGDCFWPMVLSSRGPFKVVAQSEQYYRLPFDSQKPVLYIITRQQNDARRLFISNILRSLASKLQDFLDTVQQCYNARSPQQACRELKQYLAEIFSAIQLSLTFIKKHVLMEEVDATVPKDMSTNEMSHKMTKIPTLTQLDKVRSEFICKKLEQYNGEIKEIRTQLQPSSVQSSINKLQNYVSYCQSSASDPQEPFPDLFLWLIVNNKRVAYIRYPVSKFIRSDINEEMGDLYGKQNTFYMKEPVITGEHEQPVAEVTCNIWFGTMRDLDEYPHDDVPMVYLHGVTSGYEDIVPREIRKRLDKRLDIYAFSRPDDDLTKFSYESRCHIYSARSLIGSDECGLNKCFCVMSFRGSTAVTQAISQTANPKWEETLAVAPIALYGNPVDIRDQNPPVTVQIFDRDSSGDDDYLGQFQMNCAVKLAKEPYVKPEFPPQLAWHKVYRNGVSSGEVLACAELFQLAGDMIYPELPRITNGTGHNLPDTIQPSQSKFKVECQFWGLREMKVPSGGSFSPMIEIEFSSKVTDSPNNNQPKIVSPIIKHYKKNTNFPEIKDTDSIGEQELSPIGNGTVTKTIELATNPSYRSPITIRCLNVEKSGNKVSLIGTCTIQNIDKYIYKYESPDPNTMDEEETVSVESKIFNSNSGNSQKSKLSHDPKLNDDQIGNGDLMTAKDILDNMTVSSYSVRSRGPSSRMTMSNSSQNLTDSEAQVGESEDGSTRLSEYIRLPRFMKRNAGSTKSSVGRINDRLWQSNETDGQVEWWSKYAASMEKRASEVSTGKEKFEKQKLVGRQKTSTKTQKMVEKYKNAMSRAKTKADKFAKINNLASFGAPTIETCKIYDQELEKEAGFEEFQDHIETFELRCGKTNFETVGKLKANLRLTEIIEPDIGYQHQPLTSPYGFDPFSFRLNRKHIELHVRVFIVKVTNLPPIDSSTGKADPYLILSIGKTTCNDISKYISGNLNPIFGARFDFNEVVLPRDNVLDIQVWHHDRISADDMIGQTNIDIEDRYFTRHRAKVGIPNKYDQSVGYNQYRDALKPSTILHNMCYKYKLASPNYDKSRGVIKIRLPDTEGGQLLKTFNMDDSIKSDKEQEVSRETLFRKGQEQLKRLGQSHGGAADGVTQTQFKEATIRPSGTTGPKVTFKDQNMESMNQSTIINEKSQTVSVDMDPFPKDYDDDSGIYKTDEMALKVLQNFQDIPGIGCELVPEHIESRALFNPAKPGVEQGRVEMWVDIYRRELVPSGPSCDLLILPRKPVEYELRVIVYDTHDVVVADPDAVGGLTMGDLYVKGWIESNDVQNTDVHFRSFNGSGNFNWRMIFKLFYLPDRERIITKKRISSFSQVETEVELPPKLNIQVWDADGVTAEDQLGTLELDLHKLPRGKKLPRLVSLDGCKNSRTINLFDQGRIRGWWPFLQKDKRGAVIVSGKVDLEIEILPAKEAENRKAGKGRDAPMALATPSRPETSLAWLNNPVVLFRYVFWESFKWKCSVFLVICFVILFVMIFIFGLPRYASARLVGFS